MEDQFTLDEIGAKFGSLLAQSMGATTILEKRLARLQAENEALRGTVEALRARLAEAERARGLSPDLQAIADEAKVVIDRQ